MRIANYREGQRFLPLQPIELLDCPHPDISVSDGAGSTYYEGPPWFLVGGALGTHRICCGSETLTFDVEAKTAIDDSSGQYSELLTMLHYTMVSESGERNSVLWNGKLFRFFICWLRDHVHVMKGMKYFSEHLKTAIELYRDSQREDGMIYDNVYPRTADPNFWDVRFTEGDFIKPFSDYTAEFKRIPVENDVEYLFLEGVYYTWKATGDTAWMESCLDACRRALHYSRNDEYRWSKVYGLLKRGYTIDTWDFQSEEDRDVEGDIMRVRPGLTRFGVMFGDNTGFATACRQLAEMLDSVGLLEEASNYRLLGNEILERLQQVSWLGTHYRHHVSEDPGIVRDLGVDEASQVSLSNAYSLNRGIGMDKCRAIIKSYQSIQANLPEGSPGEWYTIYPPFERGFGGHSNKWQYMNASVTPIVAGELARGAFESGEEAYGLSVLDRLVELGRKHGNRFHCSYTGSVPEPRPMHSEPVDVGTLGNLDLRGVSNGRTKWPNGENDFRELPVGRHATFGVEFELPESALGISDAPGFAAEVVVPVHRTAASLYFLHCQSSGAELCGTLVIRYADGSQVRHPVLRGRDVTTWWMPEEPRAHGERKLAIGWKGSNPVLPYVGLSIWAFDNPHPEKTIRELVLEAAPEGALWTVAGITTSNEPATLGVSPISFGIPDGWGAAAVVYALLEGLSGIVDTGIRFRTPTISPRWTCTQETGAAVTVVYPASGGYVSYRFRHDAAARTVSLELTGSGQSGLLRILLPQGATSATVGGQPVTTERVADSVYACIELPHLGPQKVDMIYA
jgi:hypothetical protein